MDHIRPHPRCRIWDEILIFEEIILLPLDRSIIRDVIIEVPYRHLPNLEGIDRSTPHESMDFFGFRPVLNIQLISRVRCSIGHTLAVMDASQSEPPESNREEEDFPPFPVGFSARKPQTNGRFIGLSPPQPSRMSR